MRPRVYIETTIPSFYYEVRTAPDMVARRQWTRQWWDNRRAGYEVVTSEAVLDELRQGDFPIKDEALGLVDELPILEVEDAVVEIIETYIDRRVMPADPAGDALHLGLASFHKCDFLLLLATQVVQRH